MLFRSDARSTYPHIVTCIFCSIAAGDIPAAMVYESDAVVAFHDIDPKAPVHLVVVPRAHHANVHDLTVADPALAAELLRVSAELGAVHHGGFRLVLNTGEDGGQSVDHVHAHVLAGRGLGWPPG